MIFPDPSGIHGALLFENWTIIHLKNIEEKGEETDGVDLVVDSGIF